MEGAQLYRQLALYKNSLFEQGYLDGQFNQLEELQDESNPHFVDEVVTMYLKDSARLLSNMEQALEKNPPDFKKLDAVIHQFRGSSSSIGAVRINNECVIFKQFCDEKNKEGCIKCFNQVKREHALLKRKMDRYLEIERQITRRGNRASN
ncbi:unnamed protein product [Victoria cruziana]